MERLWISFGSIGPLLGIVGGGLHARSASVIGHGGPVAAGAPKMASFPSFSAQRVGQARQ